MSDITDEVVESLRLVEDLKFFLATAPANWQENQVIRRYYLNNDEGFVSCVYWNNLYFITGTDIVRCIHYKFQHFGRTITDRKKFEEGIFSDLRNLKAGTDAVLENPKSDFLEFLYKNSCLRTQKKQKVFFWFNVPHDKLMADALERDIKKEKQGLRPTSVAQQEPALLFNYVEDKTRSLFEQLSEHLALLRFDVNVKEEPAEAPRVEEEEVQEVKQENDDEPDDDFPLDYLDKEFGRDFITLDANHHTGSFINALDTDFDSIDPAMFQSLVSVVSNTDDYLIEQTVPSRAVPSSTLMFFPRLAKYDDPGFFQPTAATPVPMHFPPSAIAALVAPPAMYEPGYYYHEEPPAAGPFEGEYYHPQMTPVAPVQPVVHFEHPPPGYPGYGYYEDLDYAKRFAVPSQRQQEISESMMRKRQQHQNGLNRVSKPDQAAKNRIAEYESKLREHARKEAEVAEHSLIPTPDSTVNNQDQYKHSPHA